MAIVSIFADELYPKFELEEWKEGNFKYEVPDEFVERYHRVTAEFRELQDFMENLKPIGDRR